MSYRKNGLRVLGLMFVAAIGVMAFAAAAQAVTPEYAIKGALALEASATGEQEGRGTLLVPNLNLELNCEKLTVKEGLILTSTDADAKLLYEECSALEISAPLGELPCTVSDVGGGSPTSKHVTATALLKPIEFTSGDFGVLAEKLTVQVNFLSGTGCPLPLKSVISGTVCALIETSGSNGNETVKPLILLSEAIQKSAGCEDKLLYGTNESFIDGKATLALTGAHAGLTLGVLLF